MNLEANKLKGTFALLKDAFTDFMEDKALRLAAALAYYSIFSIAPLLVIAIAIAGMVFGAEAARGQLNQQMASYVGPQAASAVESMVQSASKPSQGVFATIAGFVVLLLGASGVFGQLKDALNTIWEVRVKSGTGVKGFIKERLLSFGMVLVIGFLMLTSLILTAAMAGFTHKLSEMLPMPPVVWGVLTFLVSVAVVTLLFAMIFKVLPDAKVEWKDVWVGALVTAILFEIGKFALGLYLGKQGAESAYGAATAIVLLLLWIYYTSCIMFFGAEFTQVYARNRGRVIEPAECAELDTPQVRAGEVLTESGGHAGLAAALAKPQPARESLPRPVPQPMEELPAPVQEPQPLAGLLTVTGVSLLFGLLARGWANKTRTPAGHLKEGFAGLGVQAGAALAGALDRARAGVERRIK